MSGMHTTQSLSFQPSTTHILSIEPPNTQVADFYACLTLLCIWHSLARHRPGSKAILTQSFGELVASDHFSAYCECMADCGVLVHVSWMHFIGEIRLHEVFGRLGARHFRCGCISCLTSCAAPSASTKRGSPVRWIRFGGGFSDILSK